MNLVLRSLILTAFALLCGSVVSASKPQENKELKAAVKKAVERGVAFLRQSQTREGLWLHGGPRSEKDIGTTAMCAEALLDSHIDIDDPAIQKANVAVRAKVNDLTNTYAIASVLIHLDRIDRGSEGNLIRQLGQKLLKGQHKTGGWSEHCPPRLEEVEDNFHTSFAMLGLWIAGRYNLKTKPDFRLAEQRFRKNQQPDGGWGEKFTEGPVSKSTPAMTCAGLLAIAIGDASRYRELDSANGLPEDFKRPRYRRDIGADPQVKKAIDYLANYIRLPLQARQQDLFFLWTLERVCMVYGYTRFNGIEWYPWGARELLELQTPNGSWNKDVAVGPNCGTAWALLFLAKSFLQLDLMLPAPREGNTLNDIKRRPADNQSSIEKVQPGQQGKPGEAIALAQELRVALRERENVILELLEMTKGSEYTAALAEVIPLVRPALQEKTRLALQRRLQRLKERSLQLYLGNTNTELRLATIIAISNKSEKDLIPDLIPLLQDKETAIANQAYETLKKLSGQDHGRDSNDWQKWWDERGK